MRNYKTNIKLTAISINNNHTHNDNWVVGIIDLVYSIRNENIPTQCNFRTSQTQKQNPFVKHSIVKCDELLTDFRNISKSTAYYL